METESREPRTGLAALLFDEAFRFDFFQAVRIIERLYPERKPVGHSGNHPQHEAVRFRTYPSLAFPPSQIYEITDPDGRTEIPLQPETTPPIEMTVAFMGLTGPLGVLPHYYTELLSERARQKDKRLWDFLDLFNHRIISLFYRAWEKYRFPVGYERDRSDDFTEYLFNIIGLGGVEMRGDQLYVPDEVLIYYGGLITQHPRSATAVEAILGDYFNIPVTVQQFQGQWLDLDEEDYTRLGEANHALGMTTIAGTRVWDYQSKFRLKFGPLTIKQFRSFLPVGWFFKPLIEMVRFLVGLEFDFDIQLVLRAPDIPACQLLIGDAAQPRLGWTSWLKTCEFTADDSQVDFAVEDSAKLS